MKQSQDLWAIKKLPDCPLSQDFCIVFVKKHGYSEKSWLMQNKWWASMPEGLHYAIEKSCLVCRTKTDFWDILRKQDKQNQLSKEWSDAPGIQQIPKTDYIFAY